MKIRNNWRSSRRQWDKISLRLRVAYFDIFTVEIDVSREFYMLTILNITIKNR